MNSHVLFLAHSVLAQVNICFYKPRKPRTDTLICEATKRHFLTGVWHYRLIGCDKARNVWCIFISLSMNIFTRETADVCCALTEANKTARHFGWRHHQAGVLCPGLRKKKNSKPWKVSFLDGAAFIWQQQQNVLLFFLRLNAFFFFNRSSEKSSEQGNTSVSSENILLVSPTFASYSAFSLQFSLSSALLPFLASGELYRIVGATSVQAGDTFKSTKVFRIVPINA